MIELEAWLKNSIMGIVLLGALGSILAVPLLWAIKPLWNRLLKTLMLAHITPVLRTNYELGFIDGGEKKSMLIVFFAKSLISFLLASWVYLVSLIVIAFRLTNRSQFNFSILDATFSAIGFLCVYQMLYTWWRFKATYDVHVLSEIDEAKNKPSSEGRAKMPNHSVERGRPQAALVGSLRGFAATAAPHVKRWTS